MMHMQNVCVIIISSILMFMLVNEIDASAGDQDVYFQICLEDCQKPCNKSNLSILSWGCKGECEYDCMFDVSYQRIENGLDVLQYYGKWPFYRLFGLIQEPASFLFSFLNLVSQVLGWLHYRGRVRSSYEFYYVNKAQFLINSFAWVCAAVFHTRDTYWTEKMDYFSAALVIAISLFTCIAQIIGKLNNTKSLLAGLAITLLFGCHIFYMAAIRFDYGYNMKFLVSNGIVNIILWLVWCWRQKSHRRNFVWKCALAMGATLLLAVFEVWDFPPIWWTLDGHALWHLGTTPVAYLWFSFLTDNAVYEVKMKRFLD